MLTRCPKCSSQVSAADHLTGQTVRCPRCRVCFVLKQPQPVEDGTSSVSPSYSSPRLLPLVLVLLLLLSLCALAGSALVGNHYYEAAQQKQAEVEKQHKEIRDAKEAIEPRERRVEEAIGEGIQRRGARLEVLEQAVAKRKKAVVKGEEELSQWKQTLAQREAKINQTVQEAVAQQTVDLTKKEEDLARWKAALTKREWGEPVMVKRACRKVS